MLAAPITIPLEFELALDHFLVLAGRVVRVFAHGTLEPHQFFGEFPLCHSVRILHDNAKNAIREPEGRIGLPTSFPP